MKPSCLLRLVTAVSAAVLMGTALPSIVAAQQASGGNAPIGVTVPQSQSVPPPETQGVTVPQSQGVPAPETQGVTVPQSQPAPVRVQLPRTGNPEADTQSGLPVLFGGGIGLVVLMSRGSLIRKTVRRWRQ